jgi:hypothetical protein
VPRSPREMMRAVIANLPEKTGKSLEQWLAILKKDGPAESKEQVRWLKAVHNVGHVTAQCIVASAHGKRDEYESPDKLVDGLFGKDNPVFRAIYEKVLAETKTFPDAVPKPCKTYVPFVHRVQFARIKPSGKSHVDLLLAMGDAEVPGKGRLIPVTSREARMSHVVKLYAPEDVNTEVRRWLKKAYSEAG